MFTIFIDKFFDKLVILGNQKSLVKIYCFHQPPLFPSYLSLPRLVYILPLFTYIHADMLLTFVLLLTLFL
jgi:hypothetical protein